MKSAYFLKLLGFKLKIRTNKHDTNGILSDERLAEIEYLLGNAV